MTSAVVLTSVNQLRCFAVAELQRNQCFSSAAPRDQSVVSRCASPPSPAAASSSRSASLASAGGWRGRRGGGSRRTRRRRGWRSGGRSARPGSTAGATGSRASPARTWRAASARADAVDEPVRRPDRSSSRIASGLTVWLRLRPVGSAAPPPAQFQPFSFTTLLSARKLVAAPHAPHTNYLECET